MEKHSFENKTQFACERDAIAVNEPRNHGLRSDRQKHDV
jgi:hypothetical protein